GGGGSFGGQGGGGGFPGSGQGGGGGDMDDEIPF
ncbi:MAG: single-stranded DNA-binding protein, partial [Rhizobiaceae bacterium]|nr:single-stranded DNA-binding protein [Rhizobiaceae bacterium]